MKSRIGFLPGHIIQDCIYTLHTGESNPLPSPQATKTMGSPLFTFKQVNLTADGTLDFAFKFHEDKRSSTLCMFCKGKGGFQGKWGLIAMGTNWQPVGYIQPTDLPIFPPLSFQWCQKGRVRISNKYLDLAALKYQSTWVIREGSRPTT